MQDSGRINNYIRKPVNEPVVPQTNQNTNDDLRRQYASSVQRLALQRMKDKLMFDGLLSETIRKYNSLGLNVSRESILNDIKMEVQKQRQNMSDDLESFRQRVIEPNEEKTNVMIK